jgi:hypothetical protein
VEVRRSEGTVRVLYEGVEVLNSRVDLKDLRDMIGFGASTGLVYADHITAEHAIRNVVVSDLNKHTTRK